jgi:hypothetical protein
VPKPSDLLEEGNRPCVDLLFVQRTDVEVLMAPVPGAAARRLS